MATSSQGRYVPPHLRKQNVSQPPADGPNAGPSRSSYTGGSANGPRGDSSDDRSSTARGSSRTPWAAPNHPQDHPEVYKGRSRDLLGPRDGPSGWGPRRTSHSAPPPEGARRRQDNDLRTSIAPTLYVFGDSFTGPLKLLSDDCCRVQSYKGASAKGLNNPKSVKQVSQALLPALEALLAPPPYAYMPSAGRWALLIFGNVDLQINYLWQLQHRPISAASFPSTSDSTHQAEHKTSRELQETDQGDSSDVLANATDTALKGPALGPELFVETVAKAYLAWLESAIINGRVGARIRERNTERAKSDPSRARKPPPSKVLIAAALPPLVEDEVLHRIPEKYVDRLEEDHAKAARAMERQGSRGANGIDDKPGTTSKTPWAMSKSNKEVDQDGLSTVTQSDPIERPVTPETSSSTTSTQKSSNDDAQDLLTTTTSSFTSVISEQDEPGHLKESAKTKASIEELLKHDPPLCTLPVRIGMTNHFNSLISAFCDQHPDILSFIDITAQILDGNLEASEIGAADRLTWACPVDPTNIHPLWEPTLPLWLSEIAKVGVPTDKYRITDDAEETFKAYEEDKKRRVADGAGSLASRMARTKLRDE